VCRPDKRPRIVLRGVKSQIQDDAGVEVLSKGPLGLGGEDQVRSATLQGEEIDPRSAPPRWGSTTRCCAPAWREHRVRRRIRVRCLSMSFVFGQLKWSGLAPRGGRGPTGRCIHPFTLAVCCSISSGWILFLSGVHAYNNPLYGLLTVKRTFGGGIYHPMREKTISGVPLLAGPGRPWQAQRTAVWRGRVEAPRSIRGSERACHNRPGA